MRYLFLLLLFPILSFGQSGPCIGCPKSLKGTKSSEPLSGFYGHTSEVNYFDGVRPRCFTPTANTLNGVIAGINNALCTANTRLDTLNILVEGDSILQSYIDQIIIDLDSLYNTSLTSSDTSILLSVSTNYVTNVNTWNVRADIDYIKEVIMISLDFSCLGISSTNFDTAFQALIDLACEGCVPSYDSCSEWSLFSTATISSGIASIGVTATSYSVGGVPSGMCLDQLQYIYQVLDSNGVVLPSGYGVVNAPTTLTSPYSFVIPIGYLDGARTVSLLTRFRKELCSSGQFCGTLDSTVLYAVPETSLLPMVLNNDTLTIYWNNSCRTINVFNNDQFPYARQYSALVQTASHGTETFNSTTGSLQYCPDNEFTGYDTLSYYVQDIYGQIDTALVIFHVINNTFTTSSICYTGFANGTPNDTITLNLNIFAPAGDEFAPYGVLLDFDDYLASQQLDNPSWMNGTRDTISGTIDIEIPDVGSTLDTLVFTLQMVTDDNTFYEQSFSIPLGNCDTFELYPVESASFLYAQQGTQFCVGNASNYVQTSLAVTGTGIINANGTAYTSGVCFNYVEAFASVTSPAPTSRNWVVTDMGSNYKTTEIDSGAVNLTATVSIGNTSYVQPHPSAYNSTISATGFALSSYTWYIPINHNVTTWTYVDGLGNPQCFNQYGIITFTCDE